MLAAIDVGSNTVRLLVGEVIHGQVKPHRYERKITRLKGGQSERGLAPAAMERTLCALKEFIRIAEGFELRSMRIVGTEALRSASNAREFASKVSLALNRELEIIDGKTEAELSASGVISVVDPTPENCLIIDIGGGSTEIVLTTTSNVLFQESCSLGVVALAETDAEDEKAAFIDHHLNSIRSQLTEFGLLDMVMKPDTELIGTAGTITTLAAMNMKMERYDWRRVNNYKISADCIAEIKSRMLPLTPDEREQLPGMEEGRGDLILPGIMILQGLMSLAAKKELIVSDFGLLEGVLIDIAETAAID